MYTFHNICRTCSCQGELRSLFVADPIILANMLTEVVDIKVVKDDKLPQNICTFCLEKLKSAYLFKKQCKAIQINLELYLQSIPESSYNVIYKEELSNNNSSQVTSNPEQKEDHIQNDSYNNDCASTQEESKNTDTILDPLLNTLKKEKTIENTSNDGNWDDDMDRDDSDSTTPRIEPDINILEQQQQSTVVKQRKKGSSKCLRKKGDVIRKKVECSECHKKVIDLELHMKKHLNIPHKCEICGTEMLRRNYARHLKAHRNERPYSCTICTRHFRDKYTLRLHIRTHSGERPYKCTLCEKAFTQQFLLKIHLKKHSSDEIKLEVIPDLDRIKCEIEEADFECLECNEKFTTKRGLSVHTNAIHGTTNPSKKTGLCNLCGKLLSSKSSLKEHQRCCQEQRNKERSNDDDQNTDEKTSINGGKINQNRRQHNKPHLCTLCGKILASKVSLRRHQLIHTGGKPYKCNICNQFYRHKEHLKNHRRIHTGEKPYKCTLCDKAFTERKSLTVHMRIHLGENPYSCSFCNKAFYDLSNFKRHEAFHKLNEENSSTSTSKVQKMKSNSSNINNFNLQNIPFNNNPSNNSSTHHASASLSSQTSLPFSGHL